MSAYVLSEATRKDLEEIIEYTVNTWGVIQAKRYNQQLAESFEKLGNMPGMGKLTQGLATNLKSFPIEHHMIFYKIAPHGINIIRVLHEKRLPDSKLFIAP